MVCRTAARAEERPLVGRYLVLRLVKGESRCVECSVVDVPRLLAVHVNLCNSLNQPPCPIILKRGLFAHRDDKQTNAPGSSESKSTSRTRMDRRQYPRLHSCQR